MDKDSPESGLRTAQSHPCSAGQTDIGQYFNKIPDKQTSDRKSGQIRQGQDIDSTVRRRLLLTRILK